MAEFKNPNQDPDAQKRLIIVFALTFLAILISQQLMERFGPKPVPQKPPTQTEAAAQPPQSATPSASGNASIAASPSKPSVAPALTSGTKSAAPTAPQAKQATTEAETVIENDLYRVTITNRGAQVKSWILKQHKDNKGQPLDMVHAIAAPQHGYPLSLYIYDETLRNKVNGALFISNTGASLSAPATVTFEFVDGETSVRKTFHFDHSHVVKVENTVTDKGQTVTAYPMWPSGLGDQDSAPSYGAGNLAWQNSEKIARQTAHSGFFLTGTKSISHGNTVKGPFYWAGVTDQFFSAIFLPDDPQNASLVELHKSISVVKNPEEKDQEKIKRENFSVLGVAIGKEGAPSSVRLFVGPKQLGLLQKIHAYGFDSRGEGVPMGPDLEGVTDYGFFGVIAKPLFLWLKWTHDHMFSGNGGWGWSIIFLTIVINLALFPLRYTSMKSALLQQKIAPEIKAINYKYREVKSLTDPRQAEKQREIQAVMKREGINPMAGCLPMVIQLPFLFAFYSMLSAANELRHANWLWVKDLSSPDPIYVLPVAIVVTMYVMQKITPMTGMDPAQAKMMQTIMPLMIGAISFSLPAGLGVYWVAGNIIGFALQYGMNNSKTARDIREHLAKRETKRKK
ncbi:MAG TPA: membrane protein insertase YidC [Terriglobales bacterium]|nr:membrane protein insertase YidC [Terriglobales bacterium]